jgi:nicotinate-nucleotide adenylyltransferase
MAREAVRRLNLDELLLMVARRPPHKGMAPISDSYHRYAMAVLATRAEPRISVSRLELNREGPSFTVETLRALRSLRPARYCFIAGADSLREIHLWRDCGNLFAENCMVFVPRRGVRVDLDKLKLSAEIRQTIHPLSDGERVDLAPGSAYLLDTHPPDISSTEIRSAIAEGRCLADSSLPADVHFYIRKYGLYE